MNDDTKIGGASAKFPSTRRSAIAAGCSPRPEERRQAFDKIVAAYWKPVYKFIRVKWNQSNEDAKDLTQAFFTHAMNTRLLEGYNADKSSFRTFMRACVNHFVINESKYAQRMKRGGDATRVSLDKAEELTTARTDEIFEKEWLRNLFALALDDLQELCAGRDKPVHFLLFERYDIEHESVSYAELATEFRIAVTDVTNHLAWSRREFRRLILERIREITMSDAEFRREARLLLGATTPLPHD